MEKIKFASSEEALQHLADITGNRIKIAWQDQSKDLLQDVAKEVTKNPALLLKLNNATDFKIKQYLPVEIQDSKIRGTNKGQIKVVQDIESDVIKKITDELQNIGDRASRGKVLDFVNKNKKDFPDFNAKHKKGLQKDDAGPYYRSNVGLLQKGIDTLKGDSKGSTSDEDKAKSKEEAKARDKENKIKKEESAKDSAEQAKKDKSFKSIQSITLKTIKKLPESKVRNLLEEVVKDPDLKELRTDFLEVFKKSIDDGNIKTEDAVNYIQIMDDYSDLLDKYSKDSDFTAFAKDIAKQINTIEQEVKKKLKDTPAEEGKEKPLDLSVFDQWQQEAQASLSQEINNMVDTWLKTKNK